MFDDAIQILLRSLTFAFDLLDQLLTAFGGLWQFVFACFIISLTYKYILSPIIGSSGSDKARKKKDDVNE